MRPFGAGSTTFAANKMAPRAYFSVTGRRGCVVARLTTHRAPPFIFVKWHNVTKSLGRKGPKFFVADHDTFVCSSSLAMSWHSSQNSLNSLARLASANNA